jgi:PilZ domain
MTMASSNLQVTDIPVRSEVRQRVVHLVEYSRYPRRDPREDRRVAYTQDRSKTGLGLDLPEAIEPGELLRITLRGIDGEVDMDGLARVVWCKASESGRARAGLEMLREGGEKPMMRSRNSTNGSSGRRRTSGAN